MQFIIFSVPAIDGQRQTDELNAFIRGHKIIDVEKRFVDNGERSYWSFCVRYTLGVLPVSLQAKKERVDYREVLSEPHFQVFSKLRQLRKLIAEEEAIPAYAIFTDEELFSQYPTAEAVGYIFTNRPFREMVKPFWYSHSPRLKSWVGGGGGEEGDARDGLAPRTRATRCIATRWLNPRAGG